MKLWSRASANKPSTSGQPLAGALALVALAGVLLWAGRELLFTTFMIYDDEGYVIISLRNYGLGGPLYEAVYTQYGPAFFALLDAVSRLFRFEWSNASARWFTLVMWFGTAAFPAALVGRTTRSFAASAFTFVITFVFMWVLIREPSDPGGIIGLLVALAAYLGARKDPAAHVPTAVALGAIGALLLLTKINVGVFFLTSAGGWLLAHALTGRHQQVAVSLAGAWMILLPVMLMRGLMSQGWVIEFMLLAALAGIAIWLIVLRHAQTRDNRRAIVAMIGSAVAVGLLVLGVTVARGSSVGGVLRGVILEPFSHPQTYAFAFDWLPGSLFGAGLALGFVLIQNHLPVALRLTVINLARVVSTAGLLAGFTGMFSLSTPALAMSFAPAAAAWCACSLPGTDPQATNARVRRWLALLLVGQFMHAFPVAGSQVNWATFLLLPLITLAVIESWTTFISNPSRPGWITLAAPCLSFLLSAVITLKLVETTRQQQQQTGEYLGVPGTERMRITDEIVFAQKSIIATARANGDMLFSLPGCYSLNLWSGLPTPTQANATHWFKLLAPDKQEQIETELRKAKAPLVVVQRNVLQLLVDHGFTTASPLSDYIQNHFAPVFSVDGYSLWARAGQAITPLDIAFAHADKVTIHISSLAAPVARLDWWALVDGRRILIGSVAPQSVPLTMAAIDRSGPAATAEGWETAPPDGPVTLALSSSAPEIAGVDRLLLCLVDAEGRRLAAVRCIRP